MECKQCGTMLTANTLDRCPNCQPQRGEWSFSAMLMEVFSFTLGTLIFWSVAVAAGGCLYYGFIGAPVFVGVLLLWILIFFGGLPS